MKRVSGQGRYVTATDASQGVVVPVIDKELRHDILAPLRRLQYAAQLLLEDLPDAAFTPACDNAGGETQPDSQHTVVCINTIQRASQELNDFLTVHLAHACAPVDSAPLATAGSDNREAVDESESIPLLELLASCSNQTQLEDWLSNQLMPQAAHASELELAVRLRATHERNWYFRLCAELGRLFTLNSVTGMLIQHKAANPTEELPTDTGAVYRIELEFIRPVDGAAVTSAVTAGTANLLPGNAGTAECSCIIDSDRNSTELGSAGFDDLSLSSADRYSLMNCSMLCELLRLDVLRTAGSPGSGYQSVRIAVEAEPLTH